MQARLAHPAEANGLKTPGGRQHRRADTGGSSAIAAEAAHTGIAEPGDSGACGTSCVAKGSGAGDAACPLGSPTSEADLASALKVPESALRWACYKRWGRWACWALFICIPRHLAPPYRPCLVQPFFSCCRASPSVAFCCAWVTLCPCYPCLSPAVAGLSRSSSACRNA